MVGCQQHFVAVEFVFKRTVPGIARSVLGTLAARRFGGNAYTSIGNAQPGTDSLAMFIPAVSLLLQAMVNVDSAHGQPGLVAQMQQHVGIDAAAVGDDKAAGSLNNWQTFQDTLEKPAQFNRQDASSLAKFP